MDKASRPEYPTPAEAAQYLEAHKHKKGGPRFAALSEPEADQISERAQMPRWNLGAQHEHELEHSAFGMVGTTGLAQENEHGTDGRGILHTHGYLGPAHVHKFENASDSSEEK
eukprot:EC124933.1.p3 GENE.EC124933.1~~EC124933.1.p3  ORF type:complete len:113 (+),score=15.59 EC124933.1:195-533(+)